jgi:Flp pilus assembly protein TadG
MFSLRKTMRGEEGSSLVEMAVVLSFLFVPLVVGIVGFGMLVYDSIEVSHAAHEGASYASQAFRANSGFTAASFANITTYAESAEPNIPASALTTNPVTLACSCLGAGSTALATGKCTAATAAADCSGATPNLFITVTTQANVTPIFNMSIFGLPSTVQFNGVSTFELAP